MSRQHSLQVEGGTLLDVDKWENLVEKKEIDIPSGENILAWNHCRKSKRSKENEGHCEMIEFFKKFWFWSLYKEFLKIYITYILVPKRII